MKCGSIDISGNSRFGVTLQKNTLQEWIRPDGDPDSIAAKALTKMVAEKAKDYPDPVPAFIQVGSEIAS